MLDAIGTGAGNKSKDWAEIWMRSHEYKRVTEEIETICKERREIAMPATLMSQHEYSMSWIRQMVKVVGRTFTSYWRDPNYLLGK